MMKYCKEKSSFLNYKWIKERGEKNVIKFKIRFWFNEITKR